MPTETSERRAGVSVRQRQSEKFEPQPVVMATIDILRYWWMHVCDGAQHINNRLAHSISGWIIMCVRPQLYLISLVDQIVWKWLPTKIDSIWLNHLIKYLSINEFAAGTRMKTIHPQEWEPQRMKHERIDTETVSLMNFILYLMTIFLGQQKQRTQWSNLYD